MLKRILICSALLVVLAGMSVSAQDVDKIKIPELNPLEIPEVEKVVLDNGLRLYLLQDNSLPLFNVNVRLNCGSYLEPADKIGLAGICGTVMRTGGTAKWTGDEIDEKLEGIGGTVETGLDDVEGSAFVNVLSEYTDLGLDVLAEVLRRPRFDQDKVDLALSQARTAISRRNDDVGEIALREYRKLIFGKDSPYARTAEYATLDAITQDDLIAFHNTWVRPENVQMAIFGDFDKKEIVAKVKALFGDWKRGTQTVPPPPTFDYQWRSKVYYVDKPDAAQTYIRMGHLGGMVTDADYADKIVMNSVLGLGFGSRLTNAVRTKMGLAYMAVGRYISNFAYPGYFFALASTGNSNTVKAAREMIKQIRSMQTDMPTEEEMAKGKDGYLNSFVFNFDTRREVVSRMMNYDFYGLPEDFLQKEKERVEQCTPEAVMAAAKNNLRPDNMIVLVVGNIEEFDMPLDSLGFGPAEEIDITIPKPERKGEELVINDDNIAKGRAIIEAGITAQGGLDAFKAVKTLAMKATLKLVMGEQEMGVPIEFWQQFPHNSKSEINFMGRTMVELKIGDRSWSTGEDGALAEVSKEQAAKAVKDHDRGTIRVFSAFDDPYYRPVYAGSGEVDGVAVEWVALLGADGEEMARFGFNAADNMLAAKSYFGETMRGAGTMVESYSDFKDFGGISMPTTTVTKMDGSRVMEYDITEQSVNVELPADMFAIPE